MLEKRRSSYNFVLLINLILSKMKCMQYLEVINKKTEHGKKHLLLPLLTKNSLRLPKKADYLLDGLYYSIN
jgi:hypothetical protein